jgi:hypothetical protein
MGMLDRYKKKGGFIQLLQLIETSGKSKQDQFLGLIAQESPAWESEIRKKMITLDKVLQWNSIYLSEIFSRLHPLTLASAFHGFPDEKVNLVLKAISTTDLRKFQMTMQEINPNPAEKVTSQMKILSETRALISQGILKLDKINPELIINDSIEEKLNDSSFTSSTVSGCEKVNENLNHSTTNANLRNEIKSEENESKKKELNFESKVNIGETSKEDIQFLRKKINQLVNENNVLKHEISVLRNKLDQIKKIA